MRGCGAGIVKLAEKEKFMNWQKFWMVMGTFGIVAAVSGCSHAPKAEEVKVEAPEFKVSEAAAGGRESWHDDASAWAREMGKSNGYDVEKNYYYSGQGQSASKRTACEKAQANLVDDIAKNVAVFVDSAVARASSEASSDSSSGTSASGEVSEEVSRVSSQLSKAQLNGITVKKNYWEKRDYSEHGGARSIYYCWTLAEVGKQDIQTMISRAKTLRLQTNADLRDKVETKLSDLSADYDKYQQQHQ